MFSICEPSTLSMAMHERKVSITRMLVMVMSRKLPQVAVPNLTAEAELRISQLSMTRFWLTPRLW